jgi:hypothetical protein
MNSFDLVSNDTHISNFINFSPVGDKLYVDGQTEMTKLIVAFRNFANTPEHVKALCKADLAPALTWTVSAICP